MAEPNESNVLDFRLTNIENTLNELKNVLVETKLQQRDIDDLKKMQQETLEAINSHDKRIRNLEIAPDKDKASKWELIADYLFKGILGAVVVVILAKIGLN